MTDNQTVTTFPLIKKFQSKADTYKDEARKTYRKVFLSFKNFIYGSFLSDRPFSQEILFDWYAFLRLKGMTLQKAYFYIDKLGNLYTGVMKGDKAFDDKLFKEVRNRIKEIEKKSEAILPVTLEKSSLLLNLLAGQPLPSSVDPLSLDLLLFSLCNGGMPVREIALLKKTDLGGTNHTALLIAEKYIDSKRKYIFPLDQSQLTDKQAAVAVARKITSLLPLLKIDSPAEDTDLEKEIDTILKAFWICTAVISGITPAKVASIAKTPDFYTFLSICKPTVVNSEEREDIIAKIARFISGEKKKWFAMRLRPYVRYEQLLGRLSIINLKQPFPTFFYPCDEITKRIGRKIVWRNQPVIRDIVFFKSAPADIYPFFRNIWDLAWCYRDASAGSYAVIPTKAMEDFQRAIGIFTPEFEVAPMGQLPVKPGDKVVVIGGDYANHLALILKAEKEPAEAQDTVFRIRLLDSAVNWNIGIDARLLRKAPQDPGSI